MTNEEFQKAVLGWFDQVAQRLDKMDQKFDKIEQRLDKMDQRFDKVEQRLDKMDQRLDRVEQRLDAVPLREEMERGFADVIAMLKVTQEQLTRVDTKMDILNERSLENEADIRLLKKPKQLFG